MQTTRAIPIAWVGSGSCPNWPKGWILTTNNNKHRTVSLILVSHFCHNKTFRCVGALMFQVTGDTDFDVFLEEQMQSEDSEPGYKELLRFLSQVKYYWWSKMTTTVSTWHFAVANDWRIIHTTYTSTILLNPLVHACSLDKIWSACGQHEPQYLGAEWIRHIHLYAQLCPCIFLYITCNKKRTANNRKHLYEMHFTTYARVSLF